MFIICIGMAEGLKVSNYDPALTGLGSNPGTPLQ